MNDKENTGKSWFFKQSKAVKTIITLFCVCCVGLIILSALGFMLSDSMIPGNFSESKIYDNQYLSFKYPQSLVDFTFFEDYDEERYIFFSIFEDAEPERNCMAIYSEEIDPSLSSTYLDSYYEDFINSNRSIVKNYTLEKIDFNGNPALKVTDEYTEESGSGKYGIFVFLMHKDNFYTFYFTSDNLNNCEHMFKLAKSSLILK
ncbi:MAG: hypothetical protein FWH54_05850 [Methanobrevibacter sp.]|nr:hypothetical protein [Methanobrevibacter sp.]